MKTIALLLLMVFPLVLLNAQENKKSKAEKEAQKYTEIKNLLDAKTFVFEARQANPSSGKSIQLTSFFNAKITGDSVYSYLPFYGVAYKTDYGSTTSPYHFAQGIKDYTYSESKKGFNIEFEVKNKMDIIRYYFSISQTGYASLDVTSTDRRSISFYGTIEKPREE